MVHSDDTINVDVSMDFRSSLLIGDTVQQRLVYYVLDAQFAGDFVASERAQDSPHDCLVALSTKQVKLRRFYPRVLAGGGGVEVLLATRFICHLLMGRVIAQALYHSVQSGTTSES